MDQNNSARKTLDARHIARAAAQALAAFHPQIVAEVERALQSNDVVVVGMAQNPHVKHARKLLNDAGIAFHYLEYGSYFSKWKERLAIKLWSGWPTFPQVFVRGVLIGGADLTKQALADGTLKATLTASTATTAQA
jgi:glutaredoxin-related protein